jgi:hypothetical protein
LLHGEQFRYVRTSAKGVMKPTESVFKSLRQQMAIKR